MSISKFISALVLMLGIVSLIISILLSDFDFWCFVAVVGWAYVVKYEKEQL